MGHPSRGIITLGNDAVVEWLIALFESVRCRGPLRDVPLVVIPFDDEVQQLRRLAPRYGVEVMDSDELTGLDSIGFELCPGRPVQAKMFRKFAALWGPWEQTLFLDSDVVVVDDLESTFAGSVGWDFVYFDHAVDDVFGTRDRQLLGLGPGDVPRGAIAGAWVSRRGAFSLSDLEAAVPLARRVAEVVTVMNEQVVLNLMLETSTKRIASSGALGAGLAGSTWVGSVVERDRDGGWRAEEGRVPFLHWAGNTLTPWMPHKKTFVQFRLMSESSALGRLRLERVLAENALRRAAARVRSLAQRG